MNNTIETLNTAILRIAIPSIISNVTVPLLALVDTAITGHLGAASYIGAIAVGGSIFSMIYWIFGFLRMGTGGLTAQACGKSDSNECQLVLARAVLLGACIAVLLMILQVPILDVALQLMDASPDVEQGARLYFSILIWGAPAVLCTYGMLGWLLGMQDAKSPMLVAIVQNIINIVVSLALVIGLGWKIEGVAVGTLVAQWAGVFLVASRIRKHTRRLRTVSTETNSETSVEITGRSIFDRQALRKFFAVNRDIFLRTVCLVCVLTYFTAAGSQMGDEILAANAVLMQLSLVFSYLMDGFAYAGEALGGKYYGAGDEANLRHLTRNLFGWGIVTVAIMTTVFAIFGESILTLLTDNPGVIAVATVYLPYNILFPLFAFVAFIYDGLFIGMTKTRGMLWAVFIASIVFFVLYFMLRSTLHNHALWIAYLTYLAVRGGVQYLYSRGFVLKVRQARLWASVLCLGFYFSGTLVHAQNSEPPVEIWADRTVIFPQRMALHGDETLMDILQLYPEMLVPGYGDVLSGYQLRMDNVPMLGDMRTLLTQLKAKDIELVMVVDNPGVAKGKTGLDGVVDIRMLPARKGIRGYAELQAGTEGYLLPALNLVGGTGRSTFYLNSTLDYTGHDGMRALDEHVDLRAKVGLTPRDRLFVCFGQQFTRHSLAANVDLMRSLQGRLHYFHTFNDRGTELLLLASLVSVSNCGVTGSSNGHILQGRTDVFHGTSETRVPIYVAELNTPLFSHKIPGDHEASLSMMLGYEGNVVIDKSQKTFESAAESIDPMVSMPFASRLKAHHTIANNDFYLQLDYRLGPLRLTLGDRIMWYHYSNRHPNPIAPSIQSAEADVVTTLTPWSADRWRNNSHISLIYSPSSKHQLQAAYYHKFINPSAEYIFPEIWTDSNSPSDISYYMGNPSLDAAKVNLCKLGYGYQSDKVSMRLGMRYQSISALPIPNVESSMPTWCMTGKKEEVMIDAALLWRLSRMRLSLSYSQQIDHLRSYVILGASPTFILPRDFVLGVDLRYYGSGSPLSIAYGGNIYGSLRLDKTFGKHYDVMLQYHDVFSHSRRALLAGFRYNF